MGNGKKNLREQPLKSIISQTTTANLFMDINGYKELDFYSRLTSKLFDVRNLAYSNSSVGEGGIE